MELKDFIGLHKLSGVDDTIKTTEVEYSTNVIRFILDGKTYEAIEDPSDGYRSYLGDIRLCQDDVKNRFPPQKVFCHMDNNNDNILQFFDIKTAKIVLEIGTEYIDGYYPCCVLHYTPENFSINQKKQVKNRK